MKSYVILNSQSEKFMTYDFKPVDLNEAEIYDDIKYAKKQIGNAGDDFCKVIDIEDAEIEIEKIKGAKKELNDLGGINYSALKYGQKFKVLHKGWEGKTFTHQPEKGISRQNRVTLYEFENYEGVVTSISMQIARGLKVELI